MSQERRTKHSRRKRNVTVFPRAADSRPRPVFDGTSVHSRSASLPCHPARCLPHFYFVPTDCSPHCHYFCPNRQFVLSLFSPAGCLPRRHFALSPFRPTGASPLCHSPHRHFNLLPFCPIGGSTLRQVAQPEVRPIDIFHNRLFATLIFRSTGSSPSCHFPLLQFASFHSRNRQFSQLPFCLTGSLLSCHFAQPAVSPVANSPHQQFTPLPFRPRRQFTPVPSSGPIVIWPAPVACGWRCRQVCIRP